jgi:hypothetical protein
MTEIATALAGLPSANLSTASAGYDLYEAYVWALVLLAAKNEGAVITFKARDGTVPTSFWFRTSPSHIASLAHNYCHAEIKFPGKPPLEAHIGIFVAGKSQVAHECDVAVLYKSEADTCRDRNVQPRSGKIVMAVECKFYMGSTIGINLGRSFLGLLHDVYKGDRFFIGSSDSPNVRKLFAKHKKSYELGLTPLDLRLENRLIGAFETTFKNFRSSS